MASLAAIALMLPPLNLSGYFLRVRLLSASVAVTHAMDKHFFGPFGPKNRRGSAHMSAPLAHSARKIGEGALICPLPWPIRPGKSARERSYERSLGPFGPKNQQGSAHMSAPLAHSAPQVGDGTLMWAFPLHPTKQWADRVVKGTRY